MSHCLRYLLGDILSLLETLPGTYGENGKLIPFHRRDFCFERVDPNGEKRTVFDEKIFSKIVRGDMGFYTGHFGRRDRGDAILFCQHLCDVMWEKQFYCGNDRDILSHLFQVEFAKLLPTVWSVRDVDQNLIRNCLDYPFIDLPDIKTEQLKRIRKGLELFLLYSIPPKERYKELTGIIDPERTQYLQRLRDKYRHHMDCRGQNNYNAYANLWFGVDSLPGKSGAKRKWSMTEAGTLRAQRFADRMIRRYPDKEDLIAAAEMELAGAKQRTDEYNLRDLHLSLYLLTDSDGMEHEVKLKYEELIAGRKESRLMADRFKRIITGRPAITIPEDIMEFLADDWELYIQQMVTESIRSGYAPISHPKLHIHSIEKQTIPGDEDAYHYNYTIGSIDFFRHLIFRRFLLGDSMFDGLRKKNPARMEELVMKYSRARFLLNEDSKVDPFYLMAGCGVWVISSDGYILISRRGNIQEKPGQLGYSAAGSAEYLSHCLDEDINALEADPFCTIQRELYEECGLLVPLEQLELISFGIDYERFLQQFSFCYFTEHTAKQLLNMARRSTSSHEQKMIALPFARDVVVDLVRQYAMEPGAIVSLFNIAESYL